MVQAYIAALGDQWKAVVDVAALLQSDDLRDRIAASAGIGQHKWIQHRRRLCSRNLYLHPRLKNECLKCQKNETRSQCGDQDPGGS